MIKDIIDKNNYVRINEDKIVKLKQLFSGCFNKEGELDLVSLENELNSDVKTIKEGYGLNFLGKNYAKYVASLDTETILVPDEENNSKEENKNSENIYISGDNIDALKHLVKSYSGQIKCIYIDPPYNTGSDGFAYNDKFNFTIEKLMDVLDVNDEEARRINNMTNNKSNSHSAWLTFMYPRLYLARQLLKDNGVIFISIDDNEQANLKLLCDNIYGEENFVATIPWRKRTAKSDVPFGMSQDYEWILIYAKTSLLRLSIDGKGRKYYETNDFPGRPWRIHDMTCQRTATERPNSYFTMINPKNGKEYKANKNRVWRITKDTFQKYYENNEIIFPGDYAFLNIKNPVARYFKDKDMEKAGENFGKVSVSTKLPDEVGMSQTGTKNIKELFENIPFSFPKPVSLIKYLISLIAKDGDIILDFFSGSGTTADATMRVAATNKKNLKYILVQLQEHCDINSEAYRNGYKTIDEIGQERIRKAAKKIKEETNANIDYGFKHYTIKEIDTNTLDKLEKFEPNYVISDCSILDEFGIDAVLTTWMNEDGYGLTDTYEKLELDDYTTYKCQNTIYLLNSNISDLFIKALIEKYEKEENFDCNRIVMFGYSFTLNEIQTLKDNLQQVKNIKGINVEVITRY